MSFVFIKFYQVSPLQVTSFLLKPLEGMQDVWTIPRELWWKTFRVSTQSGQRALGKDFRGPNPVGPRQSWFPSSTQQIPVWVEGHVRGLPFGVSLTLSPGPQGGTELEGFFMCPLLSGKPFEGCCGPPFHSQRFFLVRI